MLPWCFCTFYSYSSATPTMESAMNRLEKEIGLLSSSCCPLSRIAAIGLALRMKPSKPRDSEELEREKAWVRSSLAWVGDAIGDDAAGLERLALARVDRIAARLFDELDLATVRRCAIDRDVLESFRWAVGKSGQFWRLELALQSLDRQATEMCLPIVFETSDEFHEQMRHVRIHSPQCWWGRTAR